MKATLSYPGTTDTQTVEFLGLTLDDHDCTQAVVRVTGNGLVISLVHPSRVTFVEAPATTVFPSGSKLTASERECAIRGQRIVAIKSVRERTGFGLRDAKELVDKEVPVQP